jgi:integral membrane protein
MSTTLLFRITAVAEALSWTGLLVGMYLKYATDVGEGGVQLFGPIHGAAFIAYVFAAFLVARAQRWTGGTLALALAASIPPLATIWFERWATRTGRLARTSPIVVG